MNALEFYKRHESAPLPNVGDFVSLTVEELCELMEQYHQSQVNNSVLDYVMVCEYCNNIGEKSKKLGRVLCDNCFDIAISKL